LLKVSPNTKSDDDCKVQKIISVTKRAFVNAPAEAAKSQRQECNCVPPPDRSLNAQAWSSKREANNQKQQQGD
jgi:hypothetical protein